MYPKHTAGGIHPDALELTDLLVPSWSTISEGIARSGVPTCEVATPKASLKDKLKRTEEALGEARDERVELEKARDDARDKYAGIPDLSPDSDEFKAAEAAVEALGVKEDEIADLRETQVGILKMMGPSAPRRPAEDVAAGNPSDPRGWDSSQLFTSSDLREQLTRIASSSAKNKFGGIELGSVISRDAFAADVTGTTDMRRGDWVGVLPQLRRQLRVLDLIPKGTMDHNTLPYTVESGSFTTAAETAEGATKPEGEVTFTDAEAVARTIAHWMKIQKQSLADFAALRSIIDARLRYGVERRLEGQILSGNGTEPNLKGILKTTGLGVVKFAAGDLTGGADPTLKGITTILLADAQAGAIIMHPTNWQEALLAKATSGDGHYFSGGAFQVTPQVMWGLPIVPSASMPENEVLVADFEIGAQLFIREGVNVLLSDSDQDDFLKNKVTLLGEMRAALAVFRPACFTKVWLTKAAEEAG
jgi:hypothetical protein